MDKRKNNVEIQGHTKSGIGGAGAFFVTMCLSAMVSKIAFFFFDLRRYKLLRTLFVKYIVKW